MSDRPCQWCGMDRADRCVCNTITSALSRSAAPPSEDAALRGNASIVITVCPHSVDTRFNTCLLCEKALVAPPSDAAAPQTSPDFMYAIARLAIAYVEAGDADWQGAKDPSETDDDLEPTWVEFRDEVRRLRAALLDPDPR